MSPEKVEAELYVCGCGVRELVTEWDGEPEGFHGLIREVTPSGCAVQAEWWAHTSRCIRRSALAALEAAEREARGELA